jgi:hypothetical protein
MTIRMVAGYERWCFEELRSGIRGEAFAWACVDLLSLWKMDNASECYQIVMVLLLLTCYTALEHVQHGPRNDISTGTEAYSSPRSLSRQETWEATPVNREQAEEVWLRLIPS